MILRDSLTRPTHAPHQHNCLGTSHLPGRGDDETLALPLGPVHIGRLGGCIFGGVAKNLWRIAYRCLDAARVSGTRCRPFRRYDTIPSSFNLGFLFFTLFPPEMLSNTFLMADAIKTLDFSLPSYSDIKDPTASVETAKSLYVEAGKQAAPPKQGGDIGLLLPSMKKKSAEETKKTEAPPKKSSSSAKYEF
jgi:hypothetical protein